MATILFIGGEGLQKYAGVLESQGYSIVTNSNAALLSQSSYAAIVIDLQAAGEDTTARNVIESVKDERPPLIGILGSQQLPSLDLSLNLDDFIVAGASPEELSARLRHVVWKRSRVDMKKVLKCGDLTIDLANYTVHVAGKPVEITYKEYELLRFLAMNRDRVLTRETLLSKVWGYNFYGGARTVDVHIRRLRSKIEDKSNTFIETVRNVGYRFRA